jgi:hypothetical protein
MEVMCRLMGFLFKDPRQDDAYTVSSQIALISLLTEITESFLICSPVVPMV